MLIASKYPSSSDSSCQCNTNPRASQNPLIVQQNTSTATYMKTNQYPGVNQPISARPGKIIVRCSNPGAKRH